MGLLVDAVPTAHWPFWLGGLAIGLFVVLFAWLTGKALGISSGFGSLCSLLSGLPVFRRKPFSQLYALPTVAGITAGTYAYGRQQSRGSAASR